VALKRFSRDELLGNIAKLVAERSTCLRLQVGAILASEGRIISMGYNGAPAGMIHCHETNCSPANICTRTVHAEANAIAFAARKGIATEDSTLYTTHSLCNDCTKLVINAGIQRVIYWNAYRDFSPMMMLQDLGIEVSQF